MTNAHKGEVTFECNDVVYVFKLGTFAQAAIEAKTKQTIWKFFEGATKGWGISEMLIVFHAGLLKEHKLTEDEASELMDDLGMARVGEIVGEALNLAYGEADKTTENPIQARKAKAGIGMQ